MAHMTVIKLAAIIVRLLGFLSPVGLTAAYEANNTANSSIMAIGGGNELFAYYNVFGLRNEIEINEEEARDDVYDENLYFIRKLNQFGYPTCPLRETVQTSSSQCPIRLGNGLRDTTIQGGPISDLVSPFVRDPTLTDQENKHDEL